MSLAHCYSAHFLYLHPTLLRCGLIQASVEVGTTGGTMRPMRRLTLKDKVGAGMWPSSGTRTSRIRIPELQYLGSSPRSTPNSRFLLMHTLGCSRWWFKRLSSCHPYGKPVLDLQLLTYLHFRSEPGNESFLSQLSNFSSKFLKLNVPRGLVTATFSYCYSTWQVPVPSTNMEGFGFSLWREILYRKR